MNIDVRRNDDVVIVDFHGRLAVGVSDEIFPPLIDRLLDEGNKKLLLNLSDVDYIDSNGLGQLVQALKNASRHGASMRLLNPKDRVKRTLRLTNLLPMFPTHENEPDALTAFANQ